MKPVRFTLESNAVDGGSWRSPVDGLIRLAEHCEAVTLSRTTGALRERSRVGRHDDPERAAQRRAVLQSLPALPEVFALSSGPEERRPVSLSRLDDPESVLGDESDTERIDRITGALHGSKRREDLRGDEIEDVLHLNHARHAQDYFVTTDLFILRHAGDLQGLGISVVDPDEALSIAEAACAS